MIIARENKEQAVKRIMNSLKCSKQEAEEVYNSDIAIEHNEKQDFDLSPDKLKEAQKYARTGTRKTAPKPQKQAPNYQFNKRERKPNATKGGIIAELANFLENGSQFETSEVQITNKEREILLKISGEYYSVTLTYKRNLNKK